MLYMCRAKNQDASFISIAHFYFVNTVRSLNGVVYVQVPVNVDDGGCNYFRASSSLCVQLQQLNIVIVVSRLLMHCLQFTFTVFSI